MRFNGISIRHVGVAAIGVLLVVYLVGASFVADATSPTQHWQVRIGDQRVSVTDSGAGMTLFQGRLSQEVVRDDSGNLDTRSVCNGFPRVEAMRTIDDDSDHSLELALDVENCRITVDNVSSSEAGIFDALAAGANSESHEEHWGRAVVKAADGIGYALTQSKVMLDYANSLKVYDRSHICEVQSPARPLIIWHNDDCSSSPITRYSNYIKTKTTGDFHAKRAGITWDNSVHTSSAEIKGYATRYIITCKWTPSSIGNLNFGFSVRLVCDSNER